MVGNSKVVSIRAAQRRAQQPRTRTRKPEIGQASRLADWLDSKATNGTVLLVATFTVILTVVLVAALVRTPAQNEAPTDLPAPELSVPTVE